MKEKTDLENVKKIAKKYLNIPVLETEYSPMIVSHPFTKCGIVLIPYDDDYYQLDITKDKEGFEKWQSVMAKQIDAVNNVKHIYYLLNDAYRLMFVRDASNFLSMEEFSELLGEAWVSSECANEDKNVSKKELLAQFKKADKKALMSFSEFETYETLDDTLVVYRGISNTKKGSVKALSWTTSFGKAKWFAERWGNGVIYAGTINKEYVFAYFDRMGEDEVVVDFSKLQNVRVVTKPQPKPEPQSMQQ